MRVTLALLDGTVVRVPTPMPGTDRAVAPCACPACGAPAPIEVRGRGIGRHDHDTHYAQAEHVQCGALVGELRATVDTLFGIDEDRRVLNGRPRVY